ncbi:transcriptional regulator FeaR [Pseudomonas asplenii]|uniref:AraC-binding-like domain-containing protein n=1 Tax=Pseudomonas asplenii TaxID=53407 RepID=A0A1H6P1R6_9PSED|nr:transcriptional regulator FeaR [Pseudomonas fuscovaginae]SEI18529.1 AraC-binding-like domain-containing protein [Pseudomonas fuscovaginae]
MFEQADTGLHTWSQKVAAVCGAFTASFAHDNALFIGDIQLQNLGGTEIAHIRSNAGSITRHKSASDRAENRFCFLVLQQSGVMELRLDSERIELCEGDMALLDCAQTIEMLPKGLFRHVCVHLPRSKLKPGTRFGKVSCAGMSGHLLRSLLLQVSRGEFDHWAGTEDDGALEDALIALLRPALRRTQNHSSDPLRVQAERMLRAQLASPRLNPAWLAEQMGISSRQLYRLFEGEPVCRYIQRLRVEKAAHALGDPARSRSSITDIAFECGYQDAAHFSRVFRQQYQQSPRDYRRLRAETARCAQGLSQESPAHDGQCHTPPGNPSRRYPPPDTWARACHRPGD